VKTLAAGAGTLGKDIDVVEFGVPPLLLYMYVGTANA
jgi:hypothetical protein